MCSAWWEDDDDGLTIPGPISYQPEVDVQWAYWTWLAFAHDGLNAAAEIAAQSYLYEVRKIRWISRRYCGGVMWAERQRAKDVRAACAQFAEELRQERAWLAYKAGRRRAIPSPIVGSVRDWRSRRRLPGPPDMTMPWA